MNLKNGGVRALGGILLVTLLFTASAWNQFASVKDYYAAHPDPYRIDIQLDRFQDLRTNLARVPKAAYVSDLPFSDPAGSAIFFSSQYAVAPTLLVDVASCPDCEWIVGNFSKPADFAAMARAWNAEVARDFGRGAILFRRIRK